ncbi:MAG: DUF86 domain-containing protein [Deltaproteobacteria bacterium]|nr:DUF86 domain-containing protein [Deltaproteobacteria bacterium]
MSPLDQESIQFKVNRIRKNLGELEKMGKLSYHAYIREEHNKYVAERLLQVSIEAVLDIGSHIIAEEGLGEPLEYRDVFKILCQAKILPKAKLENFQNMVGLRNRIVHLYETIDHRLIHRFLRKDLDDFEAYLRMAVRYLKK